MEDRERERERTIPLPSPSSSGDGSDCGGVMILIVGDVIAVEICCLAGELILGNRECH